MDLNCGMDLENRMDSKNEMDLENGMDLEYLEMNFEHFGMNLMNTEFDFDNEADFAFASAYFSQSHPPKKKKPNSANRKD